jgi:hypothetical protein
VKRILKRFSSAITQIVELFLINDSALEAYSGGFTPCGGLFWALVGNTVNLILFLGRELSY